MIYCKCITLIQDLLLRGTTKYTYMCYSIKKKKIVPTPPTHAHIHTLILFKMFTYCRYQPIKHIFTINCLHAELPSHVPHFSLNLKMSISKLASNLCEFMHDNEEGSVFCHGDVKVLNIVFLPIYHCVPHMISIKCQKCLNMYMKAILGTQELLLAVIFP